MKEPTVDLSQFSIAFFSNTTRIGLDKAKFAPIIVPFFQAAVDNIMNQCKIAAETGNIGGKLVAYVPYTVWPVIKKSLEWFNKKHQSDEIILYYKNSPVGFIKEDIPHTYMLCPQCHASFEQFRDAYIKGIVEVKRVETTPKLTKTKQKVKKIFKESFPVESVFHWECAEHGKVTPISATI
jgi:hypothetical protein